MQDQNYKQITYKCILVGMGYTLKIDINYILFGRILCVKRKKCRGTLLFQIKTKLF